MDSPKAICKKCKHLYNPTKTKFEDLVEKFFKITLEEDPPYYELRCTKFQNEKVINPISGEIQFRNLNFKNTVRFTDCIYRECYFLNHEGQCTGYEEINNEEKTG